MTKKYNFPVYATQGGGLVRSVGNKYYFVEAPKEGMGLDVGDEMPEHWGIVPLNEKAKNECVTETEVDTFMDLFNNTKPEKNSLYEDYIRRAGETS